MGETALPPTSKKGVIHVESETLGLLANLSNSGKTLFLYLLLRQDKRHKVSEIMQICGFGGRSTYYRALSDLRQWGIADATQVCLKIEYIGVLKTGTHVLKTETPSPKFETHVLKTGTDVLKIETGGRSWIEVAEDTDALIGDGRKEQQKAVVLQAWEDMFSEVAIHINTAAQWLTLTKWNSADVVGSMVVLQESNIEPERWVGWMRRTCSNLNWKKNIKQATRDGGPRVEPEQVDAAYQYYLEKYGPEAAESYRAGMSA